jgi:hypothetical protein
MIRCHNSGCTSNQMEGCSHILHMNSHSGNSLLYFVSYEMNNHVEVCLPPSFIPQAMYPGVSEHCAGAAAVVG